MALFDDVRTALRVTTSLTDGEISTYIDTALFDMENKGVQPEFLAEHADTDEDDYMPIVKTAVIVYCKALYGRDVEASERNACLSTYRSIVASLLNGKQNVHYQGTGE